MSFHFIPPTQEENALTHNAVFDIVASDEQELSYAISHIKPICQIINIKNISATLTNNISNSQESNCFRIIISDGEYYIHGKLAKWLNYLIEGEELCLNCIVRINRFNIGVTKDGAKLVLVLGIDVLDRSLDCKIGRPQKYNENHSQTQKLIPETKLKSDRSAQPIMKLSKSPSEIKVRSYVRQKPKIKKGNKFVGKSRPIMDFTTVQLINQLQNESIAFYKKKNITHPNPAIVKATKDWQQLWGKKVLKKPILREDKKKKLLKKKKYIYTSLQGVF